MDSDACYNSGASDLPPMTDFYDLEQSMEERYIDLIIDQLHDMAENALEEDVLHTI
tara:strand:- start:1064 stop:1231 length:168 start_codon:yes stop_codon:yes gene_type:complete